jgi:N-acetyl-alpha-D-muramate 1-phosphate uridylyltransferase
MLPCLVLAGGIGSRMRPLTDTIPKALVSVAGRPFVDIQLEGLAAQGVTDVVLSIGYRGALLREHVGNGARFGVTVRYVDEGDLRLGTGGAVRLAVDSGGVGEAFFVLYGDSYLSVDFTSVERAWRNSGHPALMTVLRNDNRWGPCNASYRAGQVTLYDKARPAPEMRWIDYGLLVLTSAVVREHIAADTATDLAGLLRTLSVQGDLAGLPVTRRFYEVGSPAGVQALERLLSRQHPDARGQSHRLGVDAG